VRQATQPRTYETLREAMARTKRGQTWFFTRLADGTLTRYPKKRKPGRAGGKLLLDMAEVDLAVAGDLEELRHYQARQRAGVRR
jgi:hypothetical protein